MLLYKRIYMHNLNDDAYKEKNINCQPWLHTGEYEYQQKIIRNILSRNANAEIDSSAFVAADANIFTSKFYLGKKSWVASGAIIRGNVHIANHCSVNINAHIAGKISIGNGCRIASMASIYGFNHGHSRTDIYIKDQPATSEGVVLGEDVWVGANAVILDGVNIGSHSIVAAGAVVTKSFPAYSIIAGNPATRIKDRRKYPLASFRLDKKNADLKYHFDMTFNTHVSCHDGVVIRGWILYPELENLIIKSPSISTQVSLNKQRPDVVKTFFQDYENRCRYLKCGFEYIFEFTEKVFGVC